MVYRFFSWVRSFFQNKFLCQLCGLQKPYDNSAIIKVRYANDAIMDLVICSDCADILESSKKHGKPI